LHQAVFRTKSAAGPHQTRDTDRAKLGAKGPWVSNRPANSTPPASDMGTPIPHEPSRSIRRRPHPKPVLREKGSNPNRAHRWDRVWTTEGPSRNSLSPCFGGSVAPPALQQPPISARRRTPNTCRGRGPGIGHSHAQQAAACCCSVSAVPSAPPQPRQARTVLRAFAHPGFPGGHSALDDLAPWSFPRPFTRPSAPTAAGPGHRTGTNAFGRS